MLHSDIQGPGILVTMGWVLLCWFSAFTCAYYDTQGKAGTSSTVLKILGEILRTICNRKSPQLQRCHKASFSTGMNGLAAERSRV